MQEIQTLLIFYIRRVLNEIPPEFVKDTIIQDSIHRAELFVDTYLEPPDDWTRLHCIAMLGAYYAYVTYLIGLERNTGTLAPTSKFIIDTFRNSVVSFLNLFAKVQLDPETLQPKDDQLNVFESACIASKSLIE